jgi:2-methylcitrate dehydratase PrpD
VQATAGPALRAGEWLASVAFDELPSSAVDAVRSSLIDWFACAIAGLDEPVTQLVSERMLRYAAPGPAALMTGGSTAAPMAAMVHATAAHALDYDDTHIWTDAHFGGPTWAALLACAGSVRDTDLCIAYAAGVQASAMLAGRRLGHAMAQRGFQATGLLGRLSAAAGCCVLMKLDARRTATALSLAATQSAGLTGAFGTMAKPFQAGRAAFDGVLAADLAADGFAMSPALFEAGGGLARALVQDGFAQIADPDLGGEWEVLRTSTKPYACLHGIHPSIDAARQLHAVIAGRPIRSVRAFVAPGVPKIGHFRVPADPHEARFSVPFCVALGLSGRGTRLLDFGAAAVANGQLRDLAHRVEVVPVEGRKMYNAALEVVLEDGTALASDVPMARGHPARPLSAEELEAKFMDCARGIPSATAGAILVALRVFPADGAAARALAIMDAQAGGRTNPHRTATPDPGGTP